MTVIDADGHVTESAEQVVKYMDAPFRHRQLVFPIVPADGWDRRLITKFHDTAATADAWLRALDKGGMEQAAALPAPRALLLAHVPAGYDVGLEPSVGLLQDRDEAAVGARVMGAGRAEHSRIWAE